MDCAVVVVYVLVDRLVAGKKGPNPDSKERGHPYSLKSQSCACACA